MRNYRLSLLNLASIMMCAVISLALLAAPALAQEAEAAWNALPAETVVAGRIPNGQAIVDAMRQRTKLGAVLFKADRFQQALELIKKEQPEEWEEMNAAMVKYGFKPEDNAQLLVGQTAFALVMEQRQGDEPPLMVGLAWVEPGEDLATRIMSAIDKAMLDQTAEGDRKITRVDYELAGHPVVQLTWGEFEQVFGPDAFDFPDNFDEMTDQQRQDYFEKKQKQREEAPVEMVDQGHLMMTREGGRVYFAMVFPQSQERVAALRGEGNAKVDFAAVTGIEQAKGVLARFLTAKDAGQAGGFLSRVMASPGLTDALPKGLALFEVLGDVTPALKLVEKSPDPEQAKKTIKVLGIESLSTMAMSMTLDGNFLRSGVYATLPSPRRGLMQLIDQAELTPDVPAWVPADVTQYTHFSFDMGKAYLMVKDLVIANFGEESAQGFAMAEGQAQMMLQVDIPTLLSSVGGKHTMVAYTPRMEKPKPMRFPGMDPEDMEDVEMPPQPVKRQAWVWQLTNADVWTKLMTVIGGFAQGSEGALTAVEEQGFNGFRMKDEFTGTQGGVFLGKGYLVFTSGPDVVENILASLNSAPEGDKALANSAIAARARQILPPRPGILYQIADMNKLAKFMFDTFTTGMDFAMDQAPVGDSDPTAMIEGLKKLMPTAEEIEDVMGVSVGHAFVTDQGVVSVGVMELPAP